MADARVLREPRKGGAAGEIIEMQRGLANPPADTFDLYIGIPFCVTRCTYCSFASGEIGDGKLTEPYAEALKREIARSAELTRALGLRLRAGYIGGGTPTAITCAQLDEVLSAAMPPSRAAANGRWRPDGRTRSTARSCAC